MNVLKELFDEGSRIFDILNAVVTDHSAAFGGVDTVIRIAGTSMNQVFNVFFWDHRVPRIVREVFEALGYVVREVGSFELKMRLTNPCEVTIRFYCCPESAGSRTSVVKGIRILGCTDLTNSVIAEFKSPLSIDVVFALTELFENGHKYGGHSDEHKNIICHFVEQYGYFELYDFVRDAFKSPMTRVYVPWDCTLDSMWKVLDSITTYLSGIGVSQCALRKELRRDIQDYVAKLADRFGIQKCTGPMSAVVINREVYRNLILSIRLSSGESRVLEEFVSVSRSDFVITRIYARLVDFDKYVKSLASRFTVSFHSTGICVHTTRLEGSIQVDYTLGGVSGSITVIDVCSILSNDPNSRVKEFPYREELEVRDKWGLEEECIAALFRRLQKCPSAYDLVCLMELLREFLDGVRMFGYSSDKPWRKESAKCLKSVPDFGAVIIQDAAKDDRLLDTLDITTYLKRFELLADRPVLPELSANEADAELTKLFRK